MKAKVTKAILEDEIKKLRETNERLTKGCLGLSKQLFIAQAAADNLAQKVFDLQSERKIL
jgi:hypothetical protein